MAISKCPHCTGTHFELTTVEARDARYKHHFIQCTNCGAPFSVVDYQNPSVLLDEQAAVLQRIERSVRDLDQRLSTIEQLLRSR